MKKLFLLFISLLITNHSFLHAQWSPTNGPLGGTIRSLAASGSVLIAGSDWQGIFISSNNGMTFSHSNYIGNSVYSLAVNSQYVFAGISPAGGVLRSTDNGLTWDTTTRLLVNTAVTSVVLSGSNIYAGTYAEGVYRSTDNGLTWAQTPLNNIYVFGMAVSGNNIFAGTGFYGVYLSTDNGLTWNETSLNNVSVYSIAVNGSNIFAGTSSGGVYVSPDNGITWTQTGPANQWINTLYVNGNNIYAGTYGSGVFVSTNNGQSWTQTALNNAQVYAIIISGPNLVAGTYNYGTLVSQNNGQNWLQTSFLIEWANTLAVTGNFVFAGTNTGIFLTTNSGQLWNRLPVNTINVNALVVTAPTIIGSLLLAGNSAGQVFLSRDYGQNWSQTASFTTHAVYALSANGPVIYAGTQSDGVFYSVNNGQTWTQSTLNNKTIYSIATSNSKVFAGTYADGVYFSSDNGQTWAQTSLNTGFIKSLAVNGSYVYAGTTNNVYVSSDGGVTWNASGLALNQPVNTISVYDKYVFAGVAGLGVYVSSDNGTTWTPRNEGWGASVILSLAFDNQYLYAGTRGTSVWKRPLPELMGVRRIYGSVPKEYSLSQNYPNPFNPSTKIKFVIAKNSFVTLDMYDLLGRKVTTLTGEKLNPGIYEVEWDASNFASGIYFYKLTATAVAASSTGDFIEVKKMLMIK